MADDATAARDHNAFASTCVKAKGKVRRESLAVTTKLFIQSLRCHAVNRGKIGIEHNLLVAHKIILISGGLAFTAASI